MSRDIPQIQIDYPAELMHEVTKCPTDTVFNLAQVHGLEPPITCVNVAVTVTENYGVAALNLGTSFDVDASGHGDQGLVLDNFSDTPLVAPGATTRMTENSDEFPSFDMDFDEGLLTYDSPVTNKLISSAVPSLGGLLWVVNTRLPGLKQEDQLLRHPDEILEAIEQHRNMEHSLIMAITNAHEWSEEEPAETIVLKSIDQKEKPEPTLSKRERGPIFDDFAGIDQEIRDLSDMVKIANTPTKTLKRLGVDPIQAVLMYGPSGVGKTTLLHALANELEAEPRDISFSDVTGIFVGEWAKRLENLFEEAFASPKRTLIIIDEADGLLNTGNSGGDSNVTSVMKNMMEKLKKHPNVFVGIATNNVHLLDGAMIADKRFPLKIELRQTGQAGLREVFRRLIIGEREAKIEAVDSSSVEQLEGLINLADQFDFQELAEQAEGFSPGDIRELLSQVNRRRLLDAIDGKEVTDIPVPTQTELLQAIQRARKSRPQAL
jgi:AAA+ superfamily predicted ATPase